MAEDSLAVLRGQYVQGLQKKRRELQKELGAIEREIARLCPDETAVPLLALPPGRKRRRINDVTPASENPRNSDIWPIITDALENSEGPMHYRDLYEVIKRNGFAFGGANPWEALYARLNVESKKAKPLFTKTKPGVFTINRG